jgi:hypothetical protein
LRSVCQKKTNESSGQVATNSNLMNEQINSHEPDFFNRSKKKLDAFNSNLVAQNGPMTTRQINKIPSYDLRDDPPVNASHCKYNPNMWQQYYTALASNNYSDDTTSYSEDSNSYSKE